MNGSFRRGEIYHILSKGPVTGCEQRSGRPAIIISNDLNNKHSATLEVVYLTTKEKKALPTHVRIEAARLPSTAICEQVCTVDKTRVGDYIGKLSKYEVDDVNTAVMISLGLDNAIAATK